MEKYKDTTLSFFERAQDIVSRMTLEEKVSQMLHSAKEIKRLNIPAYNWWNEGLHGVARAGVATMFPQAIGMAATFDENLLKNVGEIVAHEGRAKYNTNSKRGDRDIYKGLTFWSPNINIFRDPRWGRGHETYGEDPYLTSRLGIGFIKGLQGNHPKYIKAAACIKHFAVHSGPEGLRHEFDAIISKKELHETYLPAFKACVMEAGVEAVMGAYNRVNGEPCCASKVLLNDLLRQEWGFKGHIVSDCWAIKDFHLTHRVTKTPVESVALALNMGCDLNCGNLYVNLVSACEMGLVKEETIDKSVIRLMTTRMKLGLFDPYDSVPFNAISYMQNDTPENNAFALEVAKRTLVLLKNENNTLPLKKKEIKSVAVIGPNADSKAALEGNYCGTASEYITVLQGIREAVDKQTRVLYAPGCHLYKDKDSVLSQFAGDRLAEAEEAASICDVAIVCLGLDANLEGEEGDASNVFNAGDKPDLMLPGLQNELLKRICETGTPVVVVNLTGSAMDLSYADANAKAIVQAWYPGSQGGRAVASLLFGDFSPCGKLPVTFYKTSEELPDMLDYSMRSGNGRTYRFMQSEALYPFGFGLSYTDFKYDYLEAIRQEDEIIITAQVTNKGSVQSYETAMLYLKHPANVLDVPNWSLKGINIVYLKPGESAKLNFKLNSSLLALFDEDGNEVIDNGEIEIYVGGSQPDKRSEYLTGKSVLKKVIINQKSIN